MKRFLIFSLCLVVFAATTGCGLVYDLVVDPRGMGTISKDNDIVAAIQAELLDDGSVSLLDVTPFCYDGDVYMVGEYVNEDQKTRILEIAAVVEGVRMVTPYLFPPMESVSCGITDNLRIEDQVREELTEDATLWSTRVEVRVVQCRVVLLGVAASLSEADKFVERAKRVKGARSVESFIKVLEE